jgi:hypothetical protein
VSAKAQSKYLVGADPTSNLSLVGDMGLSHPDQDVS